MPLYFSRRSEKDKFQLNDIKIQIFNGHLLGYGPMQKAYENGNARYIIKISGKSLNHELKFVPTASCAIFTTYETILILFVPLNSK